MGSTADGCAEGAKRTRNIPANEAREAVKKPDATVSFKAGDRVSIERHKVVAEPRKDENGMTSYVYRKTDEKEILTGTVDRVEGDDVYVRFDGGNGQPSSLKASALKKLDTSNINPENPTDEELKALAQACSQLENPQASQVCLDVVKDIYQSRQRSDAALRDLTGGNPKPRQSGLTTRQVADALKRAKDVQDFVHEQEKTTQEIEQSIQDRMERIRSKSVDEWR